MDWLWIGWYPGGAKYRAPYGAKNTLLVDIMEKVKLANIEYLRQKDS